MNSRKSIYVESRIGLLLPLAVFICLAVAVANTQAQEYMIGNWVFGNGGRNILSKGFMINGTVGQPCVGVVSNDSYQIMSGIGHNIYGVLWTTHVLEDFEQISTLPSAYTLEQNYPNPFNPTTTIRFAVPRHSQVSLILYNILGQTIATLVDKQLPAGEYQVTLNGDRLSSGVYFYRIVAGDFVQARKLVLLK